MKTRILLLAGAVILSGQFFAGMPSVYAPGDEAGAASVTKADYKSFDGLKTARPTESLDSVMISKLAESYDELNKASGPNGAYIYASSIEGDDENVRVDIIAQLPNLRKDNTTGAWKANKDAFLAAFNRGADVSLQRDMLVHTIALKNDKHPGLFAAVVNFSQCLHEDSERIISKLSLPLTEATNKLFEHTSFAPELSVNVELGFVCFKLGLDQDAWRAFTAGVKKAAGEDSVLKPVFPEEAPFIRLNLTEDLNNRLKALKTESDEDQKQKDTEQLTQDIQENFSSLMKNLSFRSALAESFKRTALVTPGFAKSEGLETQDPNAFGLFDGFRMLTPKTPATIHPGMVLPNEGLEVANLKEGVANAPEMYALVPKANKAAE